MKGEDPSSTLRAQAQADDPSAEVGGPSTPRKLFSAAVPVALLEGECFEISTSLYRDYITFPFHYSCESFSQFDALPLIS